MTFDVGDYRAIEMIAAGASAQVWLGVHVTSGDRVAMKVYPGERLDAVRREAALAAAVDHPHVVRVLDVVGDTDRAALITEYAAGGDLADLLLRRQRLTPAETLTVLLPLAAALATAHEREVVHGDVSAGNVVFDRAGRPLLADLGAGRAAAESGRPVFATPGDAAPELARGGPPTPSTDMFSLGSLALACLTGRHAWPADDLRDVLIQAAAGQWPDPGDHVAPAALVSLVRALLEHDPERRPGAATLVLGLKAAGRPEPIDLRIDPDRAAAPLPTAGAGSFAIPGPSSRSRHGREPVVAAHRPDPGPMLHPPGRVATDAGAGTARGRDSADPERLARSRAVTRRRADAVPPADLPAASGPGRMRRVLGRTSGGPGRLLFPARAARVMVLVTVCLLVTGIAGAAGLWWAGMDRSEPVAVGESGDAAQIGGPGSSSAVPSTVASRSSAAPARSSAAPARSTGASTRPGRPTAPVGKSSATTSHPVPTTSSATTTSSGTLRDEWTDTVRALDDARARALVTRDARLLDSVYTADAAARSADVGTIGTMLANGVRVSGAVHVTRQVRVVGTSPIRVVVEDSLPSYSILDEAGRVVGRTAARAVGPRVLVLVRTLAGYRISQVQTA